MTTTRRTIAGSATIRGVTLFTATESALTFRPAPPSSGITFVRTDLEGQPRIPVGPRSVVHEPRHTVLAAPDSDARLHTVEHVLSALAGMGVHDAIVEVQGPEPPIGDGSASLFVDALQEAGLTDSDTPAPEPIRIDEPIRVGSDTAFIEATPLDDPSRLELAYHLDYGGPDADIPTQDASLTIDLAAPPIDEYAAEIAPARTFCLQAEAEAMHKMGLFRHLSPKQMLVVGPDGPIDNAYRFPNEPARHKLLDLLGDLQLAGRPIAGRIVATRAGHALNHEMAARLAQIG